MRAIVAAVGCILVAAVASAQPNCFTVYLPDLAPEEGTQAEDIRTGYPVPPSWTQPVGAFYPVILTSTKDGAVYIEQADGVGEPWARQRWFDRITGISLVYWSSVFNKYLEGRMVLQGYKTMKNVAPAGITPTWAFRRTQFFNTPVVNVNLSTPVQLGEAWNFSIQNDLEYMVWLDAGQVEARLCR